MRWTYFSFGVMAAALAIRLERLLRPLPWNGPKVVVFALTAALVTATYLGAARTAKRLGVVPVEESQRAVYGLALHALIVAFLALLIPSVINHLQR